MKQFLIPFLLATIGAILFKLGEWKQKNWLMVTGICCFVGVALYVLFILTGL